MNAPTLPSELNTILSSAYCVAAAIPSLDARLARVASSALRVTNPVQLEARPLTEFVAVDNTTDLPSASNHVIDAGSAGIMGATIPSIRRTSDTGSSRRLLLRPRSGEVDLTPFSIPASAAGAGFTALALVKTTSISTGTARFLAFGDLAADKDIDFRYQGFDGVNGWTAYYNDTSGDRIPILTAPGGYTDAVTMIGLSVSLVPGANQICAFINTAAPGTAVAGHQRLITGLSSSDIPTQITDMCLHGNLRGTGSSSDVAIGPVFAFNTAFHLPTNALLAAEMCNALCDYAGITPVNS